MAIGEHTRTGESSDRHGRSPAPTPRDGEARKVAEALAPVYDALCGPGSKVRVRFWDASELGPHEADGSVVFCSPLALRYLLWSPGELGLARAFVAGAVDVEGDVFAVLADLHRGAPDWQRRLARSLPDALTAAARLGALGPPPPVPSVESRLHGLLHSRRRDGAAISHHYDVGNEFYRLFLGPSMTYSCARFVEADDTLEAAQRAKLDLVCRKLGLATRPGMRLLDVGCGWGELAIHAAREYGAQVTGVTISAEQATLGRERVREAGVEDKVSIRLQDYRELAGERFDAISSVGMFEHVGRARMATYFETLREVLEPGGRLLNHAISTPGGSRLAGRTFMNRYVFPDGELLDVGDVVLAMEQAGFEARDVESLREHYARTLRHWVANLERNWDEAVALAGEARARTWWLYMAASANGFEDGGLSVHQVLGVRPRPDGSSGMPPTRRDFG